MSLIELCENGDLEGVKAALQSGADVNTQNKNGFTGLMWAVIKHSEFNDNKQYSLVVALLLNTPNIDVNLKSNWGCCALYIALVRKNYEVLKLLLNVPNIDVNIVVSNANGWSAVHAALSMDNIEALKLLLNHPTLTVLTLNHKDNLGDTPVMSAVRNSETKLQHLVVLAADPRVDLDTTDIRGRSLEEVARWAFLLAFLSNSQHYINRHHK